MVIDPRPYQAALDQAKGTLAHDQALLKNAQAEFNRYKALYAAGVVSKESLDANEAQQGQYEGAIQSDNAAIETAQLQLNWCYIQAPIRWQNRPAPRRSRQHHLRQFNQSRCHQPAQADRRLFHSCLRISCRRCSNVSRQTSACRSTPTIAAIHNCSASGNLLTADNQIDTTTGTGKLKAVFDNKDSVLFPNQFVNVHLILENRPNALVVPSAAIQTGLNGSLFVWVINDDGKGGQVRADADGQGGARRRPEHDPRQWSGTRSQGRHRRRRPLASRASRSPLLQRLNTNRLPAHRPRNPQGPVRASPARPIQVRLRRTPAPIKGSTSESQSIPAVHSAPHRDVAADGGHHAGGRRGVPAVARLRTCLRWTTPSSRSSRSIPAPDLTSWLRPSPLLLNASSARCPGSSR